MVDQEAPLYGYNEQYFRLNPKYTKEELFGIQTKILDLISKGSEDIEKDLDLKIEQKVIRGIMMQFWRRELIKKDSHRFYTK